MEKCSAQMSPVLGNKSLKVLILIYLYYYQEDSIQKLFINVKKKKKISCLQFLEIVFFIFITSFI